VRVSEGETACGVAADGAWRWRRRGLEALLRRTLVLLAAFAAVAFLTPMSIAFAAGSASAPAAPEPVKTIALLGVQFLNDHQDLEPTTDAERARLASMADLFKSKLEASGQYKLIPVPAEEAAKIAAGPEFGNCGGCAYDYGKQIGADLVGWIVIQKVSDLILNMNVYVADVAARKLRFVHSVDIRGNTDESWTRGMTYLIKNYMLPDHL